MRQMMMVCSNEMTPRAKQMIAYMLSLSLALSLLPVNLSKTAQLLPIGGGRIVNSHSLDETTENNTIPVMSLVSHFVGYVDDVQRQKRHEDAVKTKPVAREYDIQRAEENLRPVRFDSSDITKISNLSVNEMRKTFRGTWLEGKEDELYRFEQQYGINVYFIYAVSTLESGRGKSPLAKTRQNYYGVNLDISWDSWNDNTNYFCDFITRLYVNENHISVSDIGPIYCPPNPLWAEEIEAIMTDLHESVK